MKSMKENRSKLNRQRQSTGASLALVAVCAGLIILFLIVCFQMAQQMGGLQELNYTADSAALNTAKRSMEVKVGTGPLYSDCADSTGMVGLANINRVWGKAFLINANVEEMMANQELTDQATNSGNNAFAAAQQINDNLCSEVGSIPILNSFFDQIAGQRLAKLLGNATLQPTDKIACAGFWRSSLVYRGDESNLAFRSNQIPGPLNSQIQGISTAGQTFLQGYTPLQANDKSFYFVPFHPVEMPHLISETLFKQNTADINQLDNIVNPLPNAFACYGQKPMNTNAFAIANPQKQYNLSIPHAFASINLINTAYWIVQDKQVNVTTYGYTPETQWGARQIPLGGTNNNHLDGYASLGNEFSGNTLWAAVQSVQGDSSQALALLLQKIQEIKGDFTQANLQQFLQQQTLVPDVTTYIIYPNYTSPDNTNPSMQIAPVSANSARTTLPHWLNASASNEGQTKTVLSQEPTQDQPNFDWEMVTGPGYHASGNWTMVEGALDWQPGTGTNQTLGQLSVVHNTRCYFTAAPNN